MIIMMMTMMMKSHDFLIVASRHLVGHHRAELGELYTSSVVDVVLHYCQQYDDCCFATTRWLNRTMSQLRNATTISCKKYMMSQLYIVDVLIMIIIMPTPHSSTQVFRSLLDFVPLLALPNPIPDWSARSYNICYRQSLWAFISSNQLFNQLVSKIIHQSWLLIIIVNKIINQSWLLIIVNIDWLIASTLVFIKPLPSLSNSLKASFNSCFCSMDITELLLMIIFFMNPLMLK